MALKSLRIAAVAACLLPIAGYATEDKTSTAELNDGPCSVHVHLTRPDKSVVANAWVSVRVANRSGRYDQVGVRTNQEGRAQFLGLPNSGSYTFSVRDGRLEQPEFASIDVCGSVAEMVVSGSK